MSPTSKQGTASGSAQKKSRTPSVRSVEAPRWTSLRGRMTAQERKAALRAVSSKMS